jgi:hypothetical protein
MKKYIFISLFTLIFTLYTDAQEKEICEIENIAFSEGEKLSYIISYNWFVVFSEVGLVDMTINEENINGVDAYYYKATGRTFNWWDKFFKVRDTYETWVRKDNLRPLFFERNTREGDFRQHENYVFEGDSLVYRKNKIRDNAFTYDTIKITGCTYDVMSSLLFTRNIDYSKMKSNEKIPITVVMDDKTYDLYFRYIGIENKKLKNVGTFECLKFTVLLVQGTMFHEGEDMFIWVTNDKNHIPLWAESPILIGNVKARITKIQGNRYPLTSKIK